MREGPGFPGTLLLFMRGSGFMNVITESNMIDLLNDYFDSECIKPIVVGGIVGTNIFQFALDAATSYTEFERILIVEGIQDVIGLHADIMYGNHKFYGELFDNRLINVPRDKSSLENFFSVADPIRHVPVLKPNIRANVMIINDAHMIPKEYLDQILTGCRIKVVCIVDPFDINGEGYSNVPTVVDTLHKLPNLMIRARGVYGVESRALDKSTSSILDKVHLTQRSIGKQDENQYISTDEKLIKLVQNRQRENPFKKHQKLIVRDKHIIHSAIKDESLIKHDFPLTERSMLTITQAGNNMLYLKMRVFSSKAYVYAKPTYSMTGNSGNIHVDPANILSLEDACHHRYKHAVYTPGSISALDKRECYALLKCTNHLTIVE